eukprot:s4554_g6.t1
MPRSLKLWRAGILRIRVVLWQGDHSRQSFVSHRVAEIRRLTWPAHPEVVKSLCALTSVTVCEGRLIARRFFFSFLQST